VDYPEGSNLGYRGYEAKGVAPLFPFGFGLSYTSFRYSDLQVTGGRTLSASFTVKNVGPRSGADTPQVYAAPPGGVRRLIGWKKLALKPGEAKRVTVVADPRAIAAYDDRGHRWRVWAGQYAVSVGASATDRPLAKKAKLLAASLLP
jgi:beta-glucosidase